jgi:capping protein alpha
MSLTTTTELPPVHLLTTPQLADVTKAIKSILGDDSVQNELSPAFQKYNEEQFTTTKLPGGSTEVLVSQYNSLGDGRYYDIDTQSSFDFDHATGKASAVQSYVVESAQEDLLYAQPLPNNYRLQSNTHAKV